MVWWIWIVLGAVLLAAEVILAADFFLVFFGVSGLLIGLLGLIGLDIPAWAQWLLFAALAAGGLVGYRGRLRRRLSKPDRELRPEMVGEAGVARSGIEVGERGRVDLRGASWEALNVGAAAITAGGRCIVERVDGLTLFVRAE